MRRINIPLHYEYESYENTQLIKSINQFLSQAPKFKLFDSDIDKLLQHSNEYYALQFNYQLYQTITQSCIEVALTIKNGPKRNIHKLTNAEKFELLENINCLSNPTPLY